MGFFIGIQKVHPVIFRATHTSNRKRHECVSKLYGNVVIHEITVLNFATSMVMHEVVCDAILLL